MWTFKKQVKQIKQAVKGPPTVTEIQEHITLLVNNLLEEVGITVSKDMNTTDRARRIEALGFRSHQSVVELRTLTKDKAEANKIKEVVQYYSTTYPMYKYITKALLQRVCQKYDLVVGQASLFLADIPESNLINIENFKIRMCDTTLRNSDDYFTGHNHMVNYNDTKLVSYTEASEAIEQQSSHISSSYSRYQQADLYVAATENMFNLKDSRVVNREIVRNPTDPIVLYPVQRNSVDGYLIITAWGPEASDPEVINETQN